MSIKNKVKKLGFSLMEVLIAVFIVSVLAIATMPIINKKLTKVDENLYYLAYNTVEKMAGQIVALGDPTEDPTAYNIQDNTRIALNKKNKNISKKKRHSNPLNTFVADVGKKFTNTQAFILSKFVPKVIAASVPITEEYGSWNSDDYDLIWLAYQVCANNRVNEFPLSSGAQVKVNEETGEETTDITTTYYGKQHFEDCKGYTLPDLIVGMSAHQHLQNDLLSGSYAEFCAGAPLADVAAHIIAQNGNKPDAKAFCTGGFKSACGQTKVINGNTHVVTIKYVSEDAVEDGEEEIDESLIGEGEEAEEIPTSSPTGSCYLSSTYVYNYSDSDDAQYEASKPEFHESWCTDNGYYNMKNFGAKDTIDCQCKTTSYTESQNNERMCVLNNCASSNQLPYANVGTDASGKKYLKDNNPVCCSTDFNEAKNTCCPEKSLYNPADSKCVCVSGYEMNASETKCNLVTCPSGSHPSPDGVCVVNPPITQARRFCEMITEHWNIASSNCSVFDDDSQTQDINEDVYNAAMGAKNNQAYLSFDSKVGAFKSIPANIEFANGLKMWILGDKSASISGLSHYANTISKTQNMCYKKNLTETTQIACYGDGSDPGYFCKHENTCLVLDKASRLSGAIKDARTCCSAMDVSDLQAEAASFSPPKNWREDSRAYAVSGFTVFVDINGEKGEGTLWDDVYPFFIGANGTVYPAYPLDAPKSANAPQDLLYVAGNSEVQLPVDVYYHDSDASGTTVQKKVAFSGVSYARGMCSARKVSKYTPYCMNLGEKFQGGAGFTSSNCPTSGGCTSAKTLNGNSYISEDSKASRNPCDHYNCYVAVRKKLRSF